MRCRLKADRVVNLVYLDELLETSQWDLFWVPSGVVVSNRPELLYIVSDNPFIGCMVLRTRLSDSGAKDAIGDVLRAHDGFESTWYLRTCSRPANMPDLLQRQGYSLGGMLDDLVLDLRTWNIRSIGNIGVRSVRTEDDLWAQFDVMSDVFGQAYPRAGAVFEHWLSQAQSPGSRVARFLAYIDGKLAGAASVTAFTQLSIGLLWGGCTLPEYRCRGVYEALNAARIEWAQQQKLSWGAMYGTPATSSPIMLKRGFQKCGETQVWKRPK
jgi:hypothetical protein